MILRCEATIADDHERDAFKARLANMGIGYDEYYTVVRSSYEGPACVRALQMIEMFEPFPQHSIEKCDSRR